MNRQSATRIACLSDTHVSDGLPRESLALYPHYVDLLGHEEGNRFFERVRDETGRSFRACMHSMRGQQYDRIVHGGDVTGGWQERGMCDPITQNIGRNTVRALRDLCGDVLFTVGNHDTGYRKLSTVEGSGVVMESVEACRDIFGPLYWKRQDGDMLSVGIASSLADYDGSETRLQAMRLNQEDFVESELSTRRGLPWTLYTHDLAALSSLSPLLLPHAEHCQGIVFGDLHRPLNGRIAKTLHGLRRPALRPLLRKGVLCPSVAPLWWKGYGRLDVTYQNGTMTSQRIDIPRPADSVRLPTESAWWGVAAMFRPRLARAIERVGLA